MNGPNPYQTQAVQTASPAQLVLMLYDGAIAAVTRVRNIPDPKAPGNVAAVNRDLMRVQDIIMELQLTLDHERGGAIAGSLDRLYGFCLQQLIQANVSKELEPLDDVVEVLRELRDAWEAACCNMAVASG